MTVLSDEESPPIDQKFSSEVLEELTRFIHDESGIKFTEKRQYSLCHKLDRRLRELNVDSLEDYREYLYEHTHEEIPELISEVSTNKSYFLREEAHWEFFCAEVVDDLDPSQQLNIWSPACSTGEEPYTASLCIQDDLIDNPDREDVPYRILATDISQEALREAVRGVYSESSIRHLREHKPEWLKQYFDRVGDKQWRIKDELRRHVPFREFNLTSETYPFVDTFRLIICRNVFLYFDDATIRHVLDNLVNALEQGGYLFLGHSESITQFETPLTRLSSSIYRLI